ncbi:MAG: YiiX/YebB-like N1pC/P60 family cysteine hydrolase [Syntrophomonas sp.]|nr:YiiX/YebB-like N1pC/P60 family cysteine hydrolase [Syntrophomonas sp.]
MKITSLIRSERYRMMLFPVLFLILLALIAVDNLQLASGSKDSVIYTYANSFLKGEIGSGYGSASTDKVSFAGLEPGDIVLGGWPNCAYGRFSHAGIYVGDNMVLEGYVDYGLSLQELSHYLNYSELCLLRVEANREIKEQAVAYALARQGQMFYPVAFKQGERYWNCSKIIWQAYNVQGINLDIINDLWIAPESFSASPSIKILYEKGT